MKRFYLALSLAASLLPGAASAGNEFEQGLATLWEVLWHQSGLPTRVVRWEEDIQVRIVGVNAAAHREHTLKALREVATEAGLKVIDVTDQPDAQALANLDVEITGDRELDDRQPCVTYLDFTVETRIEAAAIRMRAGDASRCIHHEAMHAMGVRGHPAGKTVLSYFPWRVDGLQLLDRVMLRAWYSPRMVAGMTPFEALPVLADELVATQPDKARAAQARDVFFASIVSQMHDYASGKGSVPAVVVRSGKSTDEGIRHGRTEMSFFLGVAYQRGATVKPDPARATQWFEHAATQGSSRAKAQLSSSS